MCIVKNHRFIHFLFNRLVPALTLDDTRRLEIRDEAEDATLASSVQLLPPTSSFAILFSLVSPIFVVFFLFLTSPISLLNVISRLSISLPTSRSVLSSDCAASLSKEPSSSDSSFIVAIFMFVLLFPLVWKSVEMAGKFSLSSITVSVTAAGIVIPSNGEFGRVELGVPD